MRSVFPHMYPHSGREMSALWTRGLIVLDTSVLLTLYAYEREPREQFFAVLEKVRERLWLPYQVAFEYQRRRLEVIATRRQAIADLATDLEKAVASWRNQHPHRDKSLTDPVLAHAKALRERRDNSAMTVRDDKIRDRLDDLYEGRIGPAPAPETLAKWQAEGEQRYRGRIPPGYKDADKPAPDKFGDLFLWFETIEHAGSETRPIIFVTDDRKEDWWDREGTETLGPSCQLRQEMTAKAKQLYYSYRPASFLEEAGKRLELKTDDAQKAAAAVSPVDQVYIPTRIQRIVEIIGSELGPDWPFRVSYEPNDPAVHRMRALFPEVDLDDLARRRRLIRREGTPSRASGYPPAPSVRQYAPSTAPSVGEFQQWSEEPGGTGRWIDVSPDFPDASDEFYRGQRHRVEPKPDDVFRPPDVRKKR